MEEEEDDESNLNRRNRVQKIMNRYLLNGRNKEIKKNYKILRKLIGSAGVSMKVAQHIFKN